MSFAPLCSRKLALSAPGSGPSRSVSSQATGPVVTMIIQTRATGRKSQTESERHSFRTSGRFRATPQIDLQWKLPKLTPRRFPQMAAGPHATLAAVIGLGMFGPIHALHAGQHRAAGTALQKRATDMSRKRQGHTSPWHRHAYTQISKEAKQQASRHAHMPSNRPAVQPSDQTTNQPSDRFIDRPTY